MKKRQHVLLAAGITATLALTACGGGNGNGNGDGNGNGNGDGGGAFAGEPSGTLNAWGFENADDVGQSRLDYAEAQLEEVDIEIDATSFDSQKFTTSFASGDVPDVVQMDRRFVPTYAAQGLLMPLDQCFEAYDVDPNERWYEAIVEDVTYDGSIYGISQFFQPPAIILNMEVLEEAGVSPEDFDTSDIDGLLDAIDAIYEEDGGTPTRLGFDPQATGQAGLWILGMGGSLVDAEGAPTLDDPSNVTGIEVLKRITDAQGGYAQMKSFTDTFDFFGENNQYVANQVGGQVNAQWYPNVLSPYIEDIDLQAVPFRNAEGEPFAVTGGQTFVIPEGAENPDAACAWALNLTSLDAWLAAGEARAETIEGNEGVNTGLFTGSPEADQAIREQYVDPASGSELDQVIDTYYEVVDYGQSYASSPAGQEITAELVNAITAALLEDKTPEEALADAQDVAMRAYEQVTAG